MDTRAYPPGTHREATLSDITFQGIVLGDRRPGDHAAGQGPSLSFRETAVFEAAAALNGIEPLAWLTDVLERMVSGRIKAHELARLLPWAWKTERLAAAVDA